jgi:hypothetical protein
MRQQGLPYVLEGGRLRNAYVLHLVNKTRDPANFDLVLQLPQGASAIVPMPTVSLPSLGDIRLPLSVDMDAQAFQAGQDVVAKTTDRQSGQVVESHLNFLGP